MEELRFGDLQIGQTFRFDRGGNRWTPEAWTKVGQFEAEKDGRQIGLSVWTKVRLEGKPLVEIL